MANDPKAAREKRAPRQPRQNAQSDHEGSAHGPEEFDVMSPETQGLGDQAGRDRPEIGRAHV